MPCDASACPCGLPSRGRKARVSEIFRSRHGPLRAELRTARSTSCTNAHDAPGSQHKPLHMPTAASIPGGAASSLIAPTACRLALIAHAAKQPRVEAARRRRRTLAALRRPTSRPTAFSRQLAVAASPCMPPVPFRPPRNKHPPQRTASKPTTLAAAFDKAAPVANGDKENAPPTPAADPPPADLHQPHPTPHGITAPPSTAMPPPPARNHQLGVPDAAPPKPATTTLTTPTPAATAPDDAGAAASAPAEHTAPALTGLVAPSTSARGKLP